jgi:hypothetical protein
MNIAVVNVPALLTVLGSAAGEGGHAGIEARSELASKSSIGWGLEQIGATADRGVHNSFAKKEKGD